MWARRTVGALGTGTVAIAVAGCEEQEARPLALTVPVAGLLAAVFVAALAWEVRWILRRLPRRPDGHGWPGRLVVVAPVLAAIGATAVIIVGSLILVWSSAVDFRRPRTEVYGWFELVILVTVLDVLILVAVGLLLPLGWGAWHARRWALVVLGLAAGVALVGQIVLCLTTPGIGTGGTVAAVEVGYLLVLAACWAAGRPSSSSGAGVDAVPVA